MIIHIEAKWGLIQDTDSH
uniref:Uncharacterized protein n=1 Tax=Anguilla anguilla TaxID=7936 RepID=A0A0E9U5M6_ANGAN